MNIERLDSLLKSKLQWEESEVHQNELDAIFSAMGIRKKRSGGLYTLLAFCLLSVGVMAYMLIGQKHFSAWDVQRENEPASASSIVHPEASASMMPEEINDRTKQLDNTGLAETLSGMQSAQRPQQQEARPQTLPVQKSKFKTVSTPSVADAHQHKKGKQEKIMEGKKFVTEDHSEIDGSLFIREDLGILTFSGLKGLRKKNYTYAAQQDFANTDYHVAKPPLLTRAKWFDRVMMSTRPEVSLWASPMMSFEREDVRPGAQEKVHFAFEEHQKKSEKPIATFNSGLKLQFTLFSFLRIGTGLGYFQTGNSYHYDYHINQVPVIDSATRAIIAYIDKPDSLSRYISASGRHVAKYLEIPISFRIHVLKTKSFILGIEPAYALQVLLSASGTYMDPVTLQLRNGESYKTRTGNLQLGIPLDFNTGKRTTLSIMPYYGRALNAVSLNPDISRHRTYAGVKLSLNYRLYNP